MARPRKAAETDKQVKTEDEKVIADTGKIATTSEEETPDPGIATTEKPEQPEKPEQLEPPPAVKAVKAAEAIDDNTPTPTQAEVDEAVRRSRGYMNRMMDTD